MSSTISLHNCKNIKTTATKWITPGRTYYDVQITGDDFTVTLFVEEADFDPSNFMFTEIETVDRT